MILLKKLTLNNFLSHENTEIEFGAGEKALIDGASGAGKSSIFDAILWALYGEGRADNRSLVRKGSKKGSVCLELYRRHEQVSDQDVVIITRSATQAGKHVLEVAIQKPDGSRAALPYSGVREIQAWIDKDLIGASYLLFINSVAYVQGNSDSFVSQTAPKRKELLLEIVKAEDYRKYYENARQRLAELDNDRNRLSGQIIELESQITALRGRVGGRSAHIQAISDNTKLLSEIEPKIAALEAESARLSALHRTIDVIADSLKAAIADRNAVEATIAAKKKKIADKPRLEKMLEAIPGYTGDIKRVEGDLAKLRETLSSAGETEAKRNEYFAREPKIHDYSAEIERIDKESLTLMESPICPSGIDCPYSGDHSLRLASLGEQSKILREAQTTEILALDAWEKEEKYLPPATDIRKLMSEISMRENHLRGLESELAAFMAVQKDIDAIAEIEAEIPGLEESLVPKNARIEDLIKQKDDAEKAAKIDEINTVNNDLRTLKSDQRGYGDAITRATAALEGIDRDETEIKSVEQKLAGIKSVELVTINEKARKVGLVKDAFGSKGIETIVIDYLLPKLEDKINDILAKLSDFRVRLDTQRKSADGESLVEGLFITILNEMNEEMPFEAYSGGEKLKISVSISEALATMQKVGFRLFDETFIGLDENSTESFADVLEGLQKNFNQVLCISHLLQIKELFEKKIVVKKNNSVSFVS